MRIILLVALAAGLAACESAERNWSHDTATQARFDNDAAFCRNEALLNLSERSDLPLDADAYNLSREREYEDCMATLGYRFGPQ